VRGNTSSVAREVHGRIRLAFGRAPAVLDETPTHVTSASTILPEIEAVAYAEDCILSGHVRLTAERLSDVLNDHDEYEIVDALVENLAGGHALEIRNTLVHRDELLLVQASGPRGNPQRRQRTRQHAITLKSGPYEVRGYIHVIPGSDPIASFRRRKPMVALTDAVITYAVDSVRQERRAAVVIVNRECVDWVAESEVEEVRLFDFPVDMSGPLIKDFTGELRANLYRRG
jgi:hypothetical protein